jgi:hypothetical protein
MKTYTQSFTHNLQGAIFTVWYEGTIERDPLGTGDSGNAYNVEITSVEHQYTEFKDLLDDYWMGELGKAAVDDFIATQS